MAGATVAISVPIAISVAVAADRLVTVERRNGVTEPFWRRGRLRPAIELCRKAARESAGFRFGIFEEGGGVRDGLGSLKRCGFSGECERAAVAVELTQK